MGVQELQVDTAIDGARKCSGELVGPKFAEGVEYVSKSEIKGVW